MDPMDGSCDCSRCPNPGSTSTKNKGIGNNLKVHKKVKLEENSFVNDLLNVVFQVDYVPISTNRKKRETTDGDKKYSNQTQNQIQSNDIKTIHDQNELTEEEIEQEEIALNKMVFNKTVLGNY